MNRVKISRSKLIKAYEDGTMIKQMERDFGITQMTIYKILDSCGIPRRMPRTGESRIVRVSLED